MFIWSKHIKPSVYLSLVWSIWWSPFDDVIYKCWWSWNIKKYHKNMIKIILISTKFNTDWPRTKHVVDTVGSLISDISGRAWSGGQCSNRGGKICWILGSLFKFSKTIKYGIGKKMVFNWFQIDDSDIFRFSLGIQFDDSDSYLIPLHLNFRCFLHGFSSSLQPPPSRDATCGRSVTGPGNGQAWDRRCRPFGKTNAAYKKWAWKKP